MYAWRVAFLRYTLVPFMRAGQCVTMISPLPAGSQPVHNGVASAMHKHACDRQRRHKPNSPFVPQCQQLAAEVYRRRKAGEDIEQLAREMKAIACTIRRAYAAATKVQVTKRKRRSK